MGNRHLMEWEIDLEMMDDKNKGKLFVCTDIICVKALGSKLVFSL